MVATPVTYTTLELIRPNGREFRRVSTADPRKPTDDEIPLIDLSAIDGDVEARKTIAAKVRNAAVNTGFFYICNHGIPNDVIENAVEQSKRFFEQPLEKKERLSYKKIGLSVGYHGIGATQVNKNDSRDRKETFSMRYDPRNDPTIDDSTPLVDSDSIRFRDHNLVWEHTEDLVGFREVTIDFWQRRLELSRKLVRIFALALDLPEAYFDDIVTHPGADALYIHYPGTSESDATEAIEVGIGSHTDIQCFTLLWQDACGGLQVLAGTDEWLDASPKDGTFVVNIGDFLQRVSNDRFKSTVHRVYNRKTMSRYSMPFFFGFNPESICQVVASCIDEQNPARYEPISCGQWHRDRLILSESILS